MTNTPTGSDSFRQNTCTDITLESAGTNSLMEQVDTNRIRICVKNAH